MGSASDPLVDRFGWSMEEVCSHWNWAPGSGFLNHSEFLLTWQLGRNALPFIELNYKAGLADQAGPPDPLRQWLSTPSTIASEFVRFRITSESGRPASNPSSSCCSALVTSETTFCLSFKVRNVWCFSRS